MLRLRRGARRRAHRALEGDASAIDAALARGGGRRAVEVDSFDLAPLVVDLFDAAPTTDIRVLRDRGVDGSSFFEDELRPNWEERSRGERAAKIEAFARLANALGSDDAAGVGPLVRTKVLVLGWAYDRLYGDELLEQLARKPQRFGRLELPT